MKKFALHEGDCREALRSLPSVSIDACVTDPPYDLLTKSRGGSGRSNEPDNPYGRHGSRRRGFMGLAWDGTGVAFDPETWRAVYRVLKPGAYLVAFGATRTFHRQAVAIEDAGFEIRDCLSWLYGQGFPKSLNIGDGRGTALKPAWEPILLARKPLIGTVAANVLAHGTGALNIDACRIPLVNERAPTGSGNGNLKSTFGQIATSEGNCGNVTPEAGRWPANVVIDETAAAALDEQSGQSQTATPREKLILDRSIERPMRTGATDFLRGSQKTPPMARGDGGGASRFFYCAKVSAEERSNSDHPTMKPISLMRWLVRLVTPPRGVVLDPFTGSGSTGVAALEEGCRFVGCEQDDHYRTEIAGPRLMAASAQGLLDFGGGAR